MSEAPQVRTQAGRGSYVPIRLETIRPDTVPGFDLYIKNGERWLLYRRADLPFTEEHRQALLKRSVPTLFFAAAFFAAGFFAVAFFAGALPAVPVFFVAAMVFSGKMVNCARTE